jgi:hypothetical protein
MRKPQNQMADLCKLACERSEKAVELVTQLVDDDTDKASLYMAVACDSIMNSAYNIYMSDEDITEDQALGKVIHAVFGALGIRKIAAAIKTVNLKEQP